MFSISAADARAVFSAGCRDGAAVDRDTRAVFPNPAADTCAVFSVGCLQAAEAVKYLLDAGELLTGQLLNCDLLGMEFQKISLLRDPDCPACGG